jgi:thiamine transport system permease protein
VRVRGFAPSRFAGSQRWGPARLGSWPVAALPLAFLALMVGAPLARLFWAGAGGALPATLQALLFDDYLRWRMLWTLLQAGATSLLALLIGVPLAWVLARHRFAGRALALRLLMLPFVVPTLVAAMGVLALFGPRGIGPNLQGTPWLLLYGNLFFNLCLVLRAAVDGFTRVGASSVFAARSLGATPWRLFWRVELPLARPWLASALCLVFLYCCAGFGLALILGGQRFATVEVEIYTLVAHELKLAEAGALALCLLLPTALAALAYTQLERRLAAPSRIEALPLRRPVGASQWALLIGAMALLLLVCGAPLLALFWRVAQSLVSGLAQAQEQAPGDAGVWSVLVDAETVLALWNTLRFSAMALALATLLGLLHALAARRIAWLRALSFLPFVVSPVTVALGLLMLYPRWSAGLPLLVAAYALLAYPFVAQALGSAWDSLPPQLEQAARSLGCSPARAFWRVLLPALAPALRRGMAFAAATALGEFAVTLFLSRPEWATLTTLIYQRLGRPGAANLEAALLLACLLMALALSVFLLIEHAPKANQRRSGGLAQR